MDWKNILLIIVAGLDMVFSFTVYSINPKNKINIFYSLFLFFASIWAFGIMMFRLLQSISFIAYLTIYTYYVAAGFIAIFFCLFSFYFPHLDRRITLSHKLLFLFGTIIILVISLPIFLVKELSILPANNVVILNAIAYEIYSIVFLFFTLIGFINLFKKLIKSDGFSRVQLKFIIYSTGIAYFFGVIFNLIYPFVGNYTMIWFGPCFTIIIVIFLSYFLFFYRHK